MSRLVRKIFTGKRIAGAHLQKICAKAYFNENGPGIVLSLGTISCIVCFRS